MLSSTTDGYLLKLHIVPRSSKTVIVGIHGDCLKIKLQAPPVDNEANQELLSFLAKTLGMPKQNLQLQAGATSKHKSVRLITAKPLAELEQLLLEDC